MGLGKLTSAASRSDRHLVWLCDMGWLRLGLKRCLEMLLLYICVFAMTFEVIVTAEPFVADVALEWLFIIVYSDMCIRIIFTVRGWQVE